MAQAPLKSGLSRRELLRYGLVGLGGAAAVAAVGRGCLDLGGGDAPATVFPHDAPTGELWEQWRRRGWVHAAYHALPLGQNIQCGICPNRCILEPGDRSHCRNRVNKDGKLYTLAYGNPCALHVDPIEKKPLYHFLPRTAVFSLATAGCVFRCLNCQNWEISQAKPEETKDAGGPELRPGAEGLAVLSERDQRRYSLFPDEAAAGAAHFGCASIAYTYSEPIAYYEYMLDTAKQARAWQIKNCWVTCGSINEEPLAELCGYLDAASVNLKGFDEKTYRTLNSGSLETVLNTLKQLKRQGVWFEVINLVVPTYTDKPEMIRRMCDWLAANLGPDYPLHFSRFSPLYKLEYLPPTPAEILLEARDIARRSGLRYVYIGNVRGIADAGTTFCPSCKKALAEREIFTPSAVHIRDGKCEFCGAAIAGVWT